MAVSSSVPNLGFACPDFRLPATDGKTYARDDFAASSVLVVMFICNHCPYVKAVEDRLLALVQAYTPKGVQFAGIGSNDAATYPEDSFDRLRERWELKKYGFPYLYDEAQDVAHAFDAVCTPDIFVYDRDRRLAYRGRIDDSWKDPDKVTRRDLAAALDALLEGKKPSPEQLPSLGCSIKWKQD
jgi:peroxiredoxin